jgi:hypothetical protein
VRIGHHGRVQGEPARNHDAARGEVPVAHPGQRLEHRFVEDEVSHPLGDDHVDGRGQADVVLTVQKFDPVEAIDLRHRPGRPDERRAIDRVDALGPGPVGKEGENPGAAAEVEHAVVGANHRLQGLLEGQGPHAVREHELMH